MAKFVSIEEAVKLIPDGASIMFGGFMGCGSAHKMFSALAEKGVKVAVVSNKPDATTKKLAEMFFPGLPAFGQRDDIPKKPAPQMVWRAMETLGVTAEESVYVGDSEVDVATARNAGLPLVAVNWGFRTTEQLVEAGAQTIVDNPDDLLVAL